MIALGTIQYLRIIIIIIIIIIIVFLHLLKYKTNVTMN